MWDKIVDLLEGFWTYQTPISFLAGIGAYHLYYRFQHKVILGGEEFDVREEK